MSSTAKQHTHVQLLLASTQPATAGLKCRVNGTVTVFDLIHSIKQA